MTATQSNLHKKGLVIALTASMGGGSLAIDALIGAGLGSKIALILPEQGLRISFGLLLILLGLHYLHAGRGTLTSLPVSEWKP